MSANTTSLAILIPTLDEDPQLVVHTATELDAAARRCLGEHTEILIYDAGSNRARIEAMTRLLDESFTEYKLIGSGSSKRPNKNLGVAYGFELASAHSLLCVDADLLTRQSESAADNIVHAAAENLQGLTVPSVRMELGRLNRLVARPLLQVGWPYLARALPVPLPGIYSLPVRTGRRAISDPRYRYHFGGELSLLLTAMRDGLSILAPQLDLTATRHRRLSSKANAARNLLSSAFIEGLLDHPESEPGQPVADTGVLMELLGEPSVDKSLEIVDSWLRGHCRHSLLRETVTPDWIATATILEELLLAPLAEFFSTDVRPPSEVNIPIPRQASAISSAAQIASLVLYALKRGSASDWRVPEPEEAYRLTASVHAVDLRSCSTDQLDRYSEYHNFGVMHLRRHDYSFPPFE